MRSLHENAIHKTEAYYISQRRKMRTRSHNHSQQAEKIWWVWMCCLWDILTEICTNRPSRQEADIIKRQHPPMTSAGGIHWSSLLFNFAWSCKNLTLCNWLFQLVLKYNQILSLELRLTTSSITFENLHTITRKPQKQPYEHEYRCWSCICMSTNFGVDSSSHFPLVCGHKDTHKESLMTLVTLLWHLLMPVEVFIVYCTHVHTHISNTHD